MILYHGNGLMTNIYYLMSNWSWKAIPNRVRICYILTKKRGVCHDIHVLAAKATRLTLSQMRDNDIVPLDGVGGAMLLVYADVHREGLMFPPFPYKGRIETEGLAIMAWDMGYGAYGLPNVEVLHT